jgi:hypothetical protein
MAQGEFDDLEIPKQWSIERSLGLEKEYRETPDRPLSLWTECYRWYKSRDSKKNCTIFFEDHENILVSASDSSMVCNDDSAMFYINKL